MKKRFWIYNITAIAICIVSQGANLVEEGKVWEFTRTETIYEDNQMSTVFTDYTMCFAGDTFIGGVQYNCMYIKENGNDYLPKPIAYLREQDGRVWMIKGDAPTVFADVFEYGSTDKEMLIYDFSLPVGDSIQIPHEPFGSVCLDSISEGPLGKTQYFTLCNAFDGSASTFGGLEVNETIGIVNGGILPFPFCVWPYTSYGTYVYLSRVTDSQGSVIYPLNDGMGVTQIDKSYIHVLPSAITVETNQKWTMTIYDVRGVAVKAYTGAGNGFVDLLGLEHGVYVVVLRSDKAVIERTKIRL